MSFSSVAVAAYPDDHHLVTVSLILSLMRFRLDEA